MNTRFALVAIALGLAAPATSALAQSYNAPAGIPAVTAPGGLEGRSGIVSASPYDEVTTGSVASGSVGSRRAVRGHDRSVGDRDVRVNDGGLLGSSLD